MGVVYSAAFDVRRLRDGLDGVDRALSITLSRAAHTDIVIDPAAILAASSYYATHGYELEDALNHEGVGPFSTYGDPFAQSLEGAIATGMAAQSWAGTIAVTFSASTSRYTLTSSGFSFAIAFGHEASAYLLGFATTSSASAASHVGTYTPTYYIDATVPGRSLDAEGDYEPGEISSLAITDDAAAFSGITRTTSPKYRAWFQAHEITRKVFKSRVSGFDRWTFEHLFEHCRCVYPFVVDDGVEVMVCVFLPEGSAFTRKMRPGGAGDDVAMSIPFNVWHAANL